MDARRRAFLADHVDPDEDRFDVSGSGDAMTAISRGVLRGAAARCTYFTSVPCDEYLRLAPDARYHLELDMFVDELAGLELRFDHLERDRHRAPELSGLWIDDQILTAWRPLAAAGDHLVIQGGRCRFKGEITASHPARMSWIVRMMTAIAAVPERRAGELATVLAQFDLVSAPTRLRIDGEGFALAQSGSEIIVGVSYAPGIDSAGAQLRTYLRANHSGGFQLAIADATLDRKHRPRWRSELEIEIGNARWLASETALPQPVRDLLAEARPNVLVATEDQIIASFAGWLTDASRLGAVLAFLRAFSSAGDGGPYR
jgi:hypothetical protein